VTPSPRDPTVDLALPLVNAASRTASDSEAEVLDLFDRCAPQLLRYVASFGLRAEEAEDVVQEVFLALFRHLALGRDQTNLTGWLFRVAHNLALKQRQHLRRRLSHAWDGAIRGTVDPAPSPETRLVQDERRQRLWAVVQALPDRDRRCVFLRAEGLTYREIATTLSLSLGGVAKSLARSMTRLVNADGG
jgi:RNA polymerase sigma-70 factor (ECF subfamily)